MSTIVLLNKPYRVLCQFTDREKRRTLADYVHSKGLYPAGRLDFDSEGLVLLSNDGKLQHYISHPRTKLWKTYWVQIEGEIEDSALGRLAAGVALKDGKTLPAEVRRIDSPAVWDRDPPIRSRKNLSTSWIELKLREGRNRQVRRMTAAVGHPTLRLIRTAIGRWGIDSLKPGQIRQEEVHLPRTSGVKTYRRR